MNQNDFFRSVFKGDISRVRQALVDGFALNFRNREGTQALLFAIESGHEHIMHLLIEAGANPFSLDDLGRTAVHVAAFWNRLSILDELVLLGLPLDEPAYPQWNATPLHYAASRGAEAAVRWLLEKGCAPDAKLSTGLTTADLARRNGHIKLSKLLEEALTQKVGADSRPRTYA